MIRNMKDGGMSNREIAEELGISRNTVRKLLNASSVNEHPHRQITSKLDPYRDRKRDIIDKHNLSAIRILEEIRKQGYDGGYTILKDYCSIVRNDRRIPAVYRYETDPGKQSQVDFGEFWYIEIDDRRKKLYAFSMILGFSRMRYAEFTTDITTENVIKMHPNAFRYYGGYNETILYHNPKQVALERKIPASDSGFNLKFRDFAEYYGIIIRLCFPYRAQTKGKIESTIKYLRRNFWNGRSFEPLEDMHAQCLSWLNSVNMKVHGTSHEIPCERLVKETLNPMDSVPGYFTRKEETRKVSGDCYVSWNGNRYNVPWTYAGREPLATEESTMKIQVDSRIIAEHEILQGTGRNSRNK